MNITALFKNQILLSGIVAAALSVCGFNGLIWNEQLVLAAHNARGHMPEVVEVSANQITDAHDGQLIHMVGQVHVKAPITDDEFAVSAKAVKLLRRVRMYQWQEVPLSEVDEELAASAAPGEAHAYRKIWSEDLINSQQFHLRDITQYQNPYTLPFHSITLVAPEVKVGAYTIPDVMLEQLNDSQSLDVSQLDLSAYTREHSGTINHDGSNLYIGEDMGQPSVGDLKVDYATVNPETVSLLATIHNGRLIPFEREDGKPIAVIKSGNLQADELMPSLHQVNPVQSDGARFISFGLFALAIYLLFKALNLPKAISGSLLLASTAQCLLLMGVWYQQQYIASVLLATIGLASLVLVLGQRR